MPRDDLSIDLVHTVMPHTDHPDCAAVLDEWTNRVANLPAEIAFMQEEIADKDRQVAECLAIITRNDASIQKWIRVNGSHVANPKEAALSKTTLENYDKVAVLQDDKIKLAARTQQVVDKHIRFLDQNIKGLVDRGEFPDDPDIPSLLRPQIPERAVRVEPSITMPLGPVSANPATLPHPRHANQHPRINTALGQAHQIGLTSASPAPATPAASLLLNQRARESSQGAAKRQRLTGGLGTLPTSSSGLARHSSLTPGTPRAGTPSSARAGSVPRVSQKGLGASKKVLQGNRQSGPVRKNKATKSGLSRVKRSGNKNSPSSTNDSELSDAESRSGEDDEVLTPHASGRDEDEDMVDIEDEEVPDNRKYCICQSVSHGDMVACDNEQCRLEWFHWTCVGLTREPVGTWICPVCTKNMKK
ncbi:hypothetical protein B7494_g2655 [Chlorociboria aeruginascens]|nr:hypothetical protein B7494_g2655 [Chlorociboria aeruginascens]